VPLLDIDSVNVAPNIRNSSPPTRQDARGRAVRHLSLDAPGEPPTLESAQNMFQSLFFDAERYDLTASAATR